MTKMFILSIAAISTLSASAAELTVSPLQTTVNLARSGTETTISPFISSLVSSLPAGIVAESKADAKAVLAGESEMTETLEITIKIIRDSNAAYSKISDKQIMKILATLE